MWMLKLPISGSIKLVLALCSEGQPKIRIWQRWPFSLIFCIYRLMQIMRHLLATICKRWER